MTVSLLGRTLAVIAFCAYAYPPQLPLIQMADARIGGGQDSGRKATDADTRLITASAMGPVRLGMTLDQAR